MQSIEQYAGTEVVTAPIKQINIEDLKFDLNNIRLSHIEMKKDHKFVEEKLREIGDIEQLKTDILGAKTVYEPLIVDSNYNVIEGNRRLAACRLILEEERDDPISFQNAYPGLDITRFSKLKCKILPENINPTAISIYLISTHMRTKKPWQLFNRALYLTTLHREYNWTFERISNQGFMSKNTAIRTVLCYDLTIKYKEKYSKKDDAWSRKYIYFWKLLTSKTLYEFRAHDENISKFSKWIFDKKFKNHTYIKHLPEILSNKQAYEKFLEIKEQDHIPGLSCECALQVIAKNDPAVVDKTFKIIKNTITTIQNFTRIDIKHIRKDTKKLQYISELEKEIVQLNKELKSNDV